MQSKGRFKVTTAEAAPPDRARQHSSQNNYATSPCMPRAQFASIPEDTALDDTSLPSVSKEKSSDSWDFDEESASKLIDGTKGKSLKEKERIHKKSRESKDELFVPSSAYHRTNSGERRGSGEDNHHHLYQQTIHGTSGVSRRPALFGVFRHKPKTETPRTTENKKPSFIQHFKAAFQGKSPKDGSAHPYPKGDSDVKYYHTVTSGTARRSNPMTRVMDIFRNKPPGYVNETPEQRGRRYMHNQQTMNAAHARLRKNAEHEKAEAAKYRRGTWLTTKKPPEYMNDPRQVAILFKNTRGLPVVTPFLKEIGLANLEQEDSQIYFKFFKYHKCYDLIPTSAKLVVFDTKLLVKKAFYALVYNGVRAAPLWDSKRREFVGMLTITDFIKILQKYYKNANITMEELEEHKLETWRDDLKNSIKPLVYTHPDSSLLDAIKMLLNNRIHRLPLIDKGNVIYILTHKRILRFLFLYINDLPKPMYLNMKLRDLNIGTFEDIEMVYEETPLIDCLRKFNKRRVSALPVVDDNNKLVNIYAKFDVINLAAEKTYDNLDVTLKEAISHRSDSFEGVHKCTLEESLYDIMGRFVKTHVHRLVVVDEENKVLGIISLSDLLYFLIRDSDSSNENESNIEITVTMTENENSPSDEVFEELAVNDEDNPETVSTANKSEILEETKETESIENGHANDVEEHQQKDIEIEE